MKKVYIGTLLTIALSSIGFYMEGGSSFKWRDYLPSRATIYCYLTSSLAYAARSYQEAVLASLAMAGDAEAIQAWRDLMATYTPSELLCMMGGQSLDQLAAGLKRVLPNIPGLSWTTRQALELALYKALEAMRTY